MVAYFEGGVSGEAVDGAGERAGTVIWAIGELGGGTAYFSQSNMVGLYRELRKSMKNGTVPDHIIFDGEALPKIPNYITRGGRAESLMLGEFVSDMSGAVVSMRPHLGRISSMMDAAGKQDAITYVMGVSDRENVTIKYDLTVYLYNRRPDRLFDLFLTNSEKVAAERDIVRSTSNTIMHEEQRLESMAGDEKRSGMETRLVDLRKKRQMHEEIASDYNWISGRYVQLIRLWFDEHSDLDMQTVFEKFGKHSENEAFLNLYFESLSAERREETFVAVKSEFDDLNAKLEAERASKAPNAQKIEEMVERVKFLAKMLTKVGHEETEEISKTAGREQMETGSGASIFRFVNMMPGTKSLSVLAQELAMDEMQATIRDAFGRKSRVNIVSERTGTLEVNGLRALVTYDPVGYSKAVRKDNSSGVMHLINAAEQRLDLIVSGHSYKASEEALPWRNRSSDYVYSVTLPPFVDRDRLREAWNTGHKTAFVSAFGNMPVTSGFYKITHDGYGFRTEFFTSEYMRMAAGKEMQRQARMLSAKLARVKPIGISERSIDEGDRAQLASKLPSELNNRLLNILLLTNGIDPSDPEAVSELIRSANGNGAPSAIHPEVNILSGRLARQMGYIDSKLRRMNFLVLTDTHVGSPGMGEPTTQILDGVVDYVAGLKGFGPYSLLLLGDNIEGNLRNHKYEVNMENNQSNVESFARFLESKGVRRGTKEYRAGMEEYMALMFERQAIPNPDIQAEKLISIIRPLLRSAELVATVSGNHVNKTHDDRSMDESIKLGMLIEAIVGEGKVLRAPGGDFGLGTYTIDGKPFFLIHRPGNPYGLIDRTGIVATMFAGDAHVFRKNIVGNVFELTSPCLQGNNSYAESIGIGVSNSLRGITLTTLVFDEEHVHPVVSTTKLVTLKELIEKGFVKEASDRIKEFESLKRNVTGKSRRVKMKRVAGA
jgi:hypothetical protein